MIETEMDFTKVAHELELDFPEDVRPSAVAHGEHPDKVCELVQQFKDMIYETGECNPHRMDDDFLIKFLRARFWKVENAYKLVRINYRILFRI